MIKIVATRCQILRLKCTKFSFGWGSAPDPAGGAYSAPLDPLAGLRGPTSKGRGRDPTPSHPLIHISGYAADVKGRHLPATDLLSQKRRKEMFYLHAQG